MGIEHGCGHPVDVVRVLPVGPGVAVPADLFQAGHQGRRVDKGLRGVPHQILLQVPSQPVGLPCGEEHESGRHGVVGQGEPGPILHLHRAVGRDLADIERIVSFRHRQGCVLSQMGDQGLQVGTAQLRQHLG